MTFGEKLKKLRIGADLKQEDVAKGIGITSRSIISYEQGETLPRSNAVYDKLADFFGTTVEFWKEEKEDDFQKAAEYAYGKKGKTTAERLVKEVAGLFAGGTLSEEDTEKMMFALQDAYWQVKKKQAEDKEKAKSSSDT